MKEHDQAMEVMRQRLHVTEERLERALDTVEEYEVRLETCGGNAAALRTSSENFSNTATTTTDNTVDDSSMKHMAALAHAQTEAARWLKAAVEAQEGLRASIRVGKGRSIWQGALLESRAVGPVACARWEGVVYEVAETSLPAVLSRREGRLLESPATSTVVTESNNTTESSPANYSKETPTTELEQVVVGLSSSEQKKEASPLLKKTRRLETQNQRHALCSPIQSPNTVKVKNLATSIAAMRAGEILSGIGKSERENDVEEAMRPEVLTPDAPSMEPEMAEEEQVNSISAAVLPGGLESALTSEASGGLDTRLSQVLNESMIEPGKSHETSDGVASDQHVVNKNHIENVPNESDEDGEDGENGDAGDVWKRYGASLSPEDKTIQTEDLSHQKVAIEDGSFDKARNHHSDRSCRIR